MKTYDLDTCIIVDPERSESSPAVVLYGGLYGWEGAWFLHEIPSYLSESVAFALPKHFTADCSVCLKELHSKISADKISSYSLCGYSRGGVEVYRNRNVREWKMLGLIDPTAPTMGGFSETVLDDVASKVRCVYWVPNWGADGYGGRIPSFAKHLREKKVKMVEQATDHRYMPSLFFGVFHRDLQS